MSLTPADTGTNTATLGDIAGLIADLVRAGLDAGLIGRTAALLAGQGQGTMPAPTLRQARNRRYHRRQLEKRLTASHSDAPIAPPLPDKESSPIPPKEINPSPQPRTSDEVLSLPPKIFALSAQCLSEAAPPQPVHDEVDGANLPSAKAGATETDLALAAYADMARATGLAVRRVLGAARRRRVGAVLRAHGLDAWREALARMAASDFCRGRNQRGRQADLEFLTQAKSFARLLEGFYDKPPARLATPGRTRPMP